MVSIKGASELLVAVAALAIASNISCLAIGFAKVSRSLHTSICHGCKAQSAGRLPFRMTAQEVEREGY